MLINSKQNNIAELPSNMTIETIRINNIYQFLIILIFGIDILNYTYFDQITMQANIEHSYLQQQFLFNGRWLNLKQREYFNHYGMPQIHFDDKIFKVVIKTKNLILESVQKNDAELIHKYIEDKPNVMKLYASGAKKTLTQTEERVIKWMKRWQDKDPFAGLSIKGRMNNQFIGYVVMGYGQANNSSQIAYLLREDMWNKGYGYESVGAVSLFLSSTLRQKKFRVNYKKDELKRIIATVHVQNGASHRILEKCGFKKYGQTTKFGNKRYEYELLLDQFQKGKPQTKQFKKVQMIIEEKTKEKIAIDKREKSQILQFLEKMEFKDLDQSNCLQFNFLGIEGQKQQANEFSIDVSCLNANEEL